MPLEREEGKEEGREGNLGVRHKQETTVALLMPENNREGQEEQRDTRLKRFTDTRPCRVLLAEVGVWILQQGQWTLRTQMHSGSLYLTGTISSFLLQCQGAFSYSYFPQENKVKLSVDL